MAKKVKCVYCGKEFDRERTENVKVNRRYAHLDCHNVKQAENEERRKVTDLIQKLYYPQNPDWNIIGTQLKTYRDAGMTYMGMFYTLTYFFVIKKNDIKTSEGIGIIPYVYDKARAYYKNMSNTYTKAAEIENTKELGVSQTENIITITHKKPKKQLIDFTY